MIDTARLQHEERHSPTSTVIDFPSGTPDSLDRFAAIRDTNKRLKQDLRMGREYQEGRINWITSIFMGMFHVGAIAALFFFSWQNLAVAVVMYF
ncbi:MAG TPA: hypothetical protein VLI45_02955, partial [Acidobacteriaceae bacterium]|nr:hypothetical protein [Acidobacteriaceae bacterium]